jgi:hypothetical protein
MPEGDRFVKVRAPDGTEVEVAGGEGVDLERIAVDLAARMAGRTAMDVPRATGAVPTNGRLPEPAAPDGELDFDWLRMRLEMCAYDYERATVIAYAAQRAGLAQSTLALAADVYRRLGKEDGSPQWRGTFSGARSHGFVEAAAGNGVWIPTALGEHFVRTGLRRAPAAQGGEAGRES